MATRPKSFRPRGAPTPRDVDHDRGSARSRGYDGRWERARLGFLRQHPLCAYCEAGAFGRKRVTAATLVDHIVPHKGDRALFWFAAWWAASCAPCHSGPKQAAERQGGPAIARLLALLNRPAKRI